MNNGHLDRAIVYLSGAIEFAADDGVSWRRQFIEKCKENNLSFHCIDPTDKPGPEEMKIGEDKEYQKNLRMSGKFEELRDYVRQYRKYDLRFVDISDFLVVCIDPTIPQWGTCDEAVTGERQRKPTLILIEGGLSKLPTWCFGMFELEDVFGSIDDLIARLVAINNGSYPMDNRWVLVRKYLD